MKIHEQSDYRRILRECLDGARAKSTKYSLAYFSRRLGQSDAYMKHVLAGRRRLNPVLVPRLARLLELTRQEQELLLALVLKQGAASKDLRAFFDRSVTKAREDAVAYSPELRLVSVFSDSLAWEIFSLAGLDGFQAEPAWIRARLVKPVSSQKVATALARLIASGALQVEDGRCTGRNIVLKNSRAVHEAYRVAWRRALTHLEDEDISRSSFDAFCLILNDESYDAVQVVLAEAKAKIAQIARSQGPKDRIAFLNLGLFPVSRLPAKT